MQNRGPRSRKVISLDAGFTMIELLMVIIIISTLGTTAMGEFIDFRRDARFAVVRQTLAAIRTGIKNQQQQMMLRCNASPARVPGYYPLMMNDITAENIPSNGYPGECTTAQVPNVAERKFVSEIRLLHNIMGETGTPNFNWYVGCPIAAGRSVASCCDTGLGYGVPSLWIYSMNDSGSAPTAFDFWACSTTFPEMASF